MAHSSTLLLFLPLGILAGLVLRVVHGTLQLVSGFTLIIGFVLHLLGVVDLNVQVTRHIVQPLLDLQYQQGMLANLQGTLESHGLVALCLIAGMMLGMDRDSEVPQRDASW